MSSQASVVPNVLKELWAQNEPSYVYTIRLVTTTEAVGIAAASGHQAFYLDLQHGNYNMDQAAAMFRAGLALGVTPMVRPPSHDPALIGLLLGAGAQGIVAPGVESEAQARALADCCKFPPIGHRATGGANGPHTSFQTMSAQAIQAPLNAATLLICMIESQEAIEAAESIAGVEGVDGLFIGTSDLTWDMGIPGQVMHERVKDAYRIAIAACKKHNKPLMVGGVKDPDSLSIYLKMGAARCYFCGNDTTFLIDGSNRQAAAMRAIDDAFFK